MRLGLALLDSHLRGHPNEHSQTRGTKIEHALENTAWGLSSPEAGESSVQGQNLSQTSATLGGVCLEIEIPQQMNSHECGSAYTRTGLVKKPLLPRTLAHCSLWAGEPHVEQGLSLTVFTHLYPL